jgi:hypothetical protein
MLEPTPVLSRALDCLRKLLRSLGTGKSLSFVRHLKMRFWCVIFCLLFAGSIKAETINTINRRVLDRVYLHGNHLIIASWRCTDFPDDGVYMDVFDRATYKSIKSIKIRDCDHEYQDNINNIVPKNGKYFVQLQHMYEDDSRTKLAVIDSRTLKIIGRYNSKNMRKAGFAPPANDEPIIYHDSKYNISIKKIGWPSREYEVTKQGVQAKVNTISWDGAIDSIILVDDNRSLFLMHNEKPYEFIIYLVDINRNEARELFRAETFHFVGPTSIARSNDFSNVVIHSNIMAFGMNRDLHTINVNNLEHGVLVDYQRGGFNNNGHGVDRNQITQVMFDEEMNRLLIFCFEGINNWRIQLRSATANAGLV